MTNRTLSLLSAISFIFLPLLEYSRDRDKVVRRRLQDAFRDDVNALGAMLDRDLLEERGLVARVSAFVEELPQAGVERASLLE